MSSTILPHAGLTPPSVESDAPAEAASETAAAQKHPFLATLGERVRALRSRRGMTRKALSLATDVSERHLANLEYGTGNASILVLHQVANALHCSLAELLGDFTTRSPEWLLIRELLEHRSESDLRRARLALHELLSGASPDTDRQGRIALIGLRVGVEAHPRGRAEAALGHQPTQRRRRGEALAVLLLERLEALLAPLFERARHESLLPPGMPDADLVNALSQYLEFDPIERQALLEQPGPLARCRAMLDLLELRSLLQKAAGEGMVH